MNANQMNAKALANTAREVIAMCDNKKFTVAKIIAHWNLCVEQSGFTGTFDCPTCYKRKTSIVGDMERIALQLDRIADDRDPLTGEKTLEQEAQQLAAKEQFDNWANTHDSRKTESEWIEIDHAEALKDDHGIEMACKVIAAMTGCDVLGIMPGICGGMYRDGISGIMRVSDIALSVARNRAHAEALEMDAQRDIDNMVEEGGAIQAQIDFYAMPLLSQRAAVIAGARAEAIAANEGLDFNIKALRGVITDIRKEGLSARKTSENVHVVCEGVFRYVNEVFGVCLSKRGFARLVCG